MPKLKNITQEQFKQLENLADDLHADLCDLCKHIESQAVDKISDPMSAARGFLCLSQSAGRTAQLLLAQAELQGMRDRTEPLRKELEAAKKS